MTEILNQLTGAHLPVLQASVSEHAGAGSTTIDRRALVNVDEILLMVTDDLRGSSDEMRIPKRPVLTQVAIPPFRITGQIHVPMEVEPADAIVMGTDRFIAMTDATIASAAHHGLERSAAVLALRRDRAHVIVVADDGNGDRPVETLEDGAAEPGAGGEAAEG